VCVYLPTYLPTYIYIYRERERERERERYLEEVGLERLLGVFGFFGVRLFGDIADA
jgi:hypothetical protein